MLFHRLRHLTFLCTVITVLFVPQISTLAYAQELTLHFIDAGEGEAILIETPEKQYALIDTGTCITGYTVLKYLESLGITTLEHLIITHMHPDHWGGSFLIAQAFTVGTLYDNGEEIKSRFQKEPEYRWYKEMIRDNENYTPLKRAEAIRLGQDITLTVLWPPKPFPFAGSNPSSLSIRLDYGNFRALLSADTTTPVEKELIRRKDDIRAEILKVGHHGHNDATSDAFLDAVSPEAAIIMTNHENVNGYPHPDTLAKLSKKNIRTLTTFEHGTIVINASQNGTYQISCERL